MADKQNEEDVLEMEGFKKSIVRKVMTWLGIVLTLGFLRLIYFWVPAWYLKSTHSKTTLANADTLLVTDIYEKKKSKLVCEIKNIDLTTFRKFVSNTYSLDSNESNRYVDEQFEAIFDNDTVVYFSDGSYIALSDNLRITVIKKFTYMWDNEHHAFRRIVGIGPGLNHQDIYHFPVYSEQQREIMRLVYGDNEISVPDTRFIIIVIRETFTLFYIIQFANCLLRGITGDWTFTGILTIFTFLIILLTSGQIKWNEAQLKKTVKSEVQIFKVMSGNDIHNVLSTNLVPGDRVILPEMGCKVPCDGIVINGSCIVNESLLTGESVPQTKTPLPMTTEDFKEKELSSFIMYSGTTMIRAQSSEPVQLLVIRTGFATAQGSVVRAILYPRPLDYNFENSVIKFAIFLFCVSLVGAIINDIIEISHKQSASEIVLNTIRISVMMIPAIMPILTGSKLIGIRRLIRFHSIYCTNPAAFNLAGSATCTCFDKTGTLTEDSLDLHSVIPSNSGVFENSISRTSPSRSVEDKNISKAMACCHSNVLIDNKLLGDPIDIKMFEWTNWDLTLAKGDDMRNYPILSPKYEPSYTIQILHQNQFSSKLQRMSVVVKCSDESQLRLYCKGSPEAITSLSHPSTVPANFTNILELYTRQGFRVLGLGTRNMDVEGIDEVRRTTREQLETQLNFLGLIVFENKLKVQTTPSIEELRNANYKITMITGDNLQTAECVARECKIINPNQTILELEEENEQIKCTVTKRNNKMTTNITFMENGGHGEDYVFSISGKAWKILREKYEHLLPRILVKAAVFARMSSDQKKEVVMELGALGYGVVMCGDGANDCDALRAADVGISLSKTESSAAASFTSHAEDISCVISVIRYGRCSLATSVSFFKYMIMSSILMTLAERFMQSLNSNLTSNENIYLNLISIANIAVWFPRADAYKGPLPPHLPIDNVISFSPLFSFLSNVIIFFSFQVCNFFLVKQFSWYKSLSNTLSYETYAMFCTVAIQIIILAIIQSPGYPFRKPLYRNILLTVFLSAIFIMDLVIILHPPQSITDWLQLSFPPKMDFPLSMLAILACNFFVCFLNESILVNKIIYNRCKRYPHLIKTKTKKKFLDIEEEIKDYNWVFQGFELCVHKYSDI